MDRITSKIRIFLISFSAFSLVLLLSVNFTDAVQLENVYLNHIKIENWQSVYSVLEKKSIVKQNANSLAELLLKKKKVHKIEVKKVFPNSFSLSTNQFIPVAFLFDKKRSKLVGIDKNLRVFPLEDIEVDWELPVIVGVSVGRMYKKCEDLKAEKLIEQFEIMSRENIDLLRMIEEINVDKRMRATLRLSGMKMKIIVPVNRLYEKTQRFIEFLTRFDTDLDQVKTINLCYGDLIVTSRGKR